MTKIEEIFPVVLEMQKRRYPQGSLRPWVRLQLLSPNEIVWGHYYSELDGHCFARAISRGGEEIQFSSHCGTSAGYSYISQEAEGRDHSRASIYLKELKEWIVDRAG